jgi:ATP-dependent HslUV protease ATP-binding subunit HslU
MATEGIKITFTDDAVDEIAEVAEKVNETHENIGARRLYTVMEKVMEDISFSAPNVRKKNIVIDRAYVQKQLKDIVEDEDLSRFIL